MSEVQTVADYFGCNVFSDKVMRDRHKTFITQQKITTYIHI